MKKQLTPILLLSALAVAAMAQEKKPVRPIDALKARYNELKEEALTCPDEAFEAKRAELLKFIASPGETNPLALVEFYVDVVRKDNQGIFDKPDVFALAKTAAGSDVAARQKYCYARFDAFYWAMNGQGAGIDKAWSTEARLAFAEEVLADEGLNMRRKAREVKLDCLKQLGRYDDCVAFLNDEIAKADSPSTKTEVYAMLADFYVWNARRYFADSDKPTLEKAAEALRKATENPADYRDKRRYLANLVTLADLEWNLGRKAEARAALDRAEEFEKKVSADVASKRGDFAFAEGDYATAADLWLPIANNWRWEKRVNLVRALYAAGRKAEAEPHLEFLSKNGNKYVRTFYAYALEQYRKEAKK